jgi:hypothetical protein
MARVKEVTSASADEKDACAAQSVVELVELQCI